MNVQRVNYNNILKLDNQTHSMSATDIDNWLETVKEGTILPERELRILCEKVKEILIEESNVQPVKAPVTICGDIHG